MKEITGQETLVEGIEFSIRESEVLRYLGRKQHSLPLGESLEKDLASEIESGKSLARPVALYRIEPLVKPENNSGFFRINNFPLRSKHVLRLFKNSRYCLIGLLTIGELLENRVSDLYKRKAYARALMLDAVGSETVEAAADALMGKMAGEINETAGPHGLTQRFSPGYGDWDIREQHLIFRLLDSERVGIKMMPSCLMVPRKSISFIVGIQPGRRRAVKKTGGDCFSVPCSLDPCKFKSEPGKKEGSK